jgi:hypothetical protein
MKILTALLIAVLLIQTTAAADRSQAPAGFTWQQIPELKAAFLKPNGWFFKREEVNGTLAYFISREGIAESGSFQTGLTVNVFHLKKGSAINRGKGLISNMALEHHADTWEQSSGPFRKFGCFVRDTDSSGTIAMQAVTIANQKTDTLYLFVFESPASDWETAYKIGKVIMDNLVLDEQT